MIWKGLYLMLKKRKKPEMLTFNFLFFFPASPTYSPISRKSYFVMIYVFSSLMSPSIQKKMLSNQCVNPVKESDSDTIIMVIVLVAGVGGVFILFALMALCYR